MYSIIETFNYILILDWSWRKFTEFKNLTSHRDLKQCIDFNTQKRIAAKDSFTKDFFKLMNNSVIVKTMENIRRE